MKTIKTGLKWIAILIAALIAMEIIGGQSEIVRACVGLAIYIGAIAYEIHKRLTVIEDHLLAMRSGSQG